MKEIRYYRTFGDPRDTKSCVRTHVIGIGDSFTLCGLDTAGDSLIHRKPPEEIDKPKRITCKDCLEIIDIVKSHLKDRKD